MEEIDVEQPPVMIDRGLSLDRYSGDTVFATSPEGFGIGEFGEAVFGWT